MASEKMNYKNYEDFIEQEFSNYNEISKPKGEEQPIQ